MISNQRGFSLVEVLLSFLLIGVGSLGLVKLQIYTEQKAEYAINSIEALHLAESKLEWFRTRGALTAFSTITPADFTSDIVNGSDASHADFTLNWTVVESFSGELKTINIQSSWEDRAGISQSVELMTMVSKYSEFD